jgi:autotransporter-associated beta strand protein
MIEVEAGAVATFDTAASATSLTVLGAIGGPGAIAKTGAILSTLNLGGANDYTGGTFVHAGMLQLLAGSVASLGQMTGAGTGAVTIDSGASVDINGVPTHIGSLYGTGELSDNSSSPSTAFIVDTDDSSPDVFSGPITGSICLVKAGSATLTMNAANGFGGGLEIDAGTLRIGSPGAVPLGTTLLWADRFETVAPNYAVTGENSFSAEFNA